VTDLADETFEQFAAGAGIRLQRAFVAAYGPERGADAVAEALGYAWEHWRRVRRMDNPLGYLYRVGQTRTRPRKTPVGTGWEPARAAPAGDRLVEPGLVDAVASLTEPQRVAVVLVHGYEWSLREVAELTGVTVSTVQTHVERALAKLRDALEVVDDA
jgi:DNA-directed RNA polymerase specialized sigma24 family protein